MPKAAEHKYSVRCESTNNCIQFHSGSIFLIFNHQNKRLARETLTQNDSMLREERKSKDKETCGMGEGGQNEENGSATREVI